MQRSSTLLTLSAGLVLAMSSAMAQTTPANTSNASTPTPVGVTPSTAAEANRKAVPNNNVGTVVRTSPNAVDKAQAAMPDSSTNTAPAATTDMTNTQRMRPARADRN